MTTKFDMGRVCEERFEGLVHHQGASIRYERVKTSNSCDRIFIFGSFLLLSFIKFFSLLLFRFFDLTFYCLFLLYLFIYLFIILYFSLPFFALVLYLFLCGFISMLPNLLGNKRHGFYCCCTIKKIC
jgi:hypothetical protein